MSVRARLKALERELGRRWLKEQAAEPEVTVYLPAKNGEQPRRERCGAAEIVIYEGGLPER